MAQESKGGMDKQIHDKLSKEFKLPKHTHKLKLVKPPLNEDSLCNICFLSYQEDDIYACELCRFHKHVLCPLGRSKEWKQHEHFIIFQRKPATFLCDACGKEDGKEPSYLCTECKFWIHQSCASLKQQFDHRDHDHMLSLVFSIPEEFRKFDLLCDVCRNELHSAYWLYICRHCGFFVHIKCAGKEKIFRVAEDNIETFPKLNMALLPEANGSVQLIVRFLKQNGVLENLTPSQIDNFHNKMHPLILSNNTSKDELVCDGCIGSIVDQCYYGCKECSYYLHVTCSQIPGDLELHHPLHPKHQLYITHPENCCSVRECSHCKLGTNGWFFECRKCEFLLDMKCALLPKAIAHKSHRHPLSQIADRKVECSACRCASSGSSYGCEACGFFLGNDCALLLATTTHKWDEHPLSLIFPPSTDRLCEVCEGFAHPKDWLYHCSECDQSFHPRCIPRHGLYRNIKFGGTIQIAEHSLKLVEKGKYKSQCGVCRNRLDKENALMCIACNLHICRDCARNVLEKKNTATISSCSKFLGILKQVGCMLKS